MAVLKPGVVTVYEEDGGAKKYFVSSGSVTINEDSSVQVRFAPVQEMRVSFSTVVLSIQILAEEAHLVSDLDAAAARKALSAAQSELASASSDVAKAEAQIAVEVAEEVVKAAEAQ